MAEQRNLYKGSPPRPWLRMVLVAADGTPRTLEALADTGNPAEMIVAARVMQQFNLGLAPGMTTNFGTMAGGWLRIQIPEIGFDETVLAYSSDAVVQAVQVSQLDFEGLAGLPLLRQMQYGGDADCFWVRS